MKRTPVIPEQHWLHEPTPTELKRENARLRSLVVAEAVALVTLLCFFVALIFIH